MARVIPPTVHSSVRSGAERRVFNMIRQSKNLEEWVCLHSLGLARHDRKRRGELDFVFISRRGIVVLEVKGGRVRRQDGAWIFTDRYDEEHRRAEGPFDQASSGMFALEKSLIQEFGYQLTKSLLFGYAVAFPDIDFDAHGVECDPAIVYDRSDRGRPFSDFLNRVLEFSRSRRQEPSRQCNPERLDAIVDFLRGDFDFCPTFEAFAADVRHELDRLTAEQSSVLDAANSAPRLIVEGPAGSGKTVLAMEETRRAARRGARALFLCFNRFLAVRVGELLARERYAGRVVVRTIHNHCGHLIEASSLRKEFEETKSGTATSEIYDEWMPLYARMAADEDVEPPFDLVVIDEGQDVLTDDYWDVISAAIASGLKHGSWRVFLDVNNQAGVFGRLEQGCIDRLRRHGRSLVLTINCRNTREIAFQVNAVTEPRIRSVGKVAGVPVEFQYYDDRHSLAGKLQGIVEALKHEAIPPGCQTLLFPKIPDPGLRKKLAAWGVQQLEDADIPNLGERTDHSTWTTVSAFKGLENDVIVLAGVDEIESTWWNSVTYVGMSRARTRLVVALAHKCRSIQSDRLGREAARLLSDGGAAVQ